MFIVLSFYSNSCQNVLLYFINLNLKKNLIYENDKKKEKNLIFQVKLKFVSIFTYLNIIL